MTLVEQGIRRAVQFATLEARNPTPEQWLVDAGAILGFEVETTHPALRDTLRGSAMQLLMMLDRLRVYEPEAGVPTYVRLITERELREGDGLT